MLDSNDKTIKSMMMSSSKSKLVLDKTVGSVMCDTLQGEISELGIQSTVTSPNKSKGFKGSATMKTIQSLQMNHSEIEKKNHSTVQAEALK